MQRIDAFCTKSILLFKGFSREDLSDSFRSAQFQKFPYPKSQTISLILVARWIIPITNDQSSIPIVASRKAWTQYSLRATLASEDTSMWILVVANTGGVSKLWRW